MTCHSLTYFCENSDYFMITAHRGASYEFPENTLLSMQKAVEAGADMIEFDLRGTKDQIPVLLHDQTIDRTSNGTGKPEEFTLEELRKFNFSYFLQGERRTAPAYENITIPTFEEILLNLRGKACMNIQVYAQTDETLKEICRLFREYEMYDYGYFTITPDYIEKVRAIDPEIEFCTTRGWKDRSNPEILQICKEQDHCRFVQPIREFTTEKDFALIRSLGLRSNVFFSDDPEEMQKLSAMGACGILTNKAHLMCRNRKNGLVITGSNAILNPEF